MARATLNGQLVDDGGETCQVGFEWSLYPDMSTSSFIVGSGAAPLSFSLLLIDLLPSTTYYFRALAINSVGTVYGNILSFVTPAPTAIPPEFINIGLILAGMMVLPLLLGKVLYHATLYSNWPEIKKYGLSPQPLPMPGYESGLTVGTYLLVSKAVADEYIERYLYSLHGVDERYVILQVDLTIPVKLTPSTLMGTDKHNKPLAYVTTDIIKPSKISIAGFHRKALKAGGKYGQRQ